MTVERVDRCRRSGERGGGDGVAMRTLAAPRNVRPFTKDGNPAGVPFRWW